MRIRHTIALMAIALVFASVLSNAWPQQTPQTPAPTPAGARGQGTGNRGGAPPAIAWPSPPLPNGPMVVETAIQRNVKLFVTKGLNQPWSMAFLPDGGI